MSLTQFAIEKNRITWTLLAAVMFAGLISYKSLPRAEDPGFVVVQARVTAYFPGARPERVENLVTDVIEEVVQEMPEVEYIESRSRMGVSVIDVVLYETYSDLRPIWDDLRRKMEDAALLLPDGAFGPFVNDEFGDVFGIVLAITGDDIPHAELQDYADAVKDQILRLPDVAEVGFYGSQEERIFVEYDNARLAEVGLSPSQLRQILRDVNIVEPGGRIVVDHDRFELEATGNFNSLEDLRRTIVEVPAREGQWAIYALEDLAHIYQGYIDPPRVLMGANGQPAIGITVAMEDGGNMVRLGQDVRDVIDRLKAAWPVGIEFDEVHYLPDHVDKKVNDFMVNLAQAVGIVLVVMLLFMGVRTGLIVASLVPGAMIMTLFVMNVLGYGLDQITLAALIISLGILVDNAIVVSEAIMVSVREGKTVMQAALSSTKELMLPLFISTLTTTTAFLPVYLAQSNMGQYTGPLYPVLLITLLCSWTLAFTVIPLLCVLFLKVKKDEGGSAFEAPLYRAYRRLLLLLLRNRVVGLTAVGAAFAASCWGFGFIPVAFMPPSDKAIFTAELEMPAGTPIERTIEVVDDIDRFIAEDLTVDRDSVGVEGGPEGVIHWGTFIGAGAPRFYLPASPEEMREDYAMMLITATSRDTTFDLIEQITTYVDEHHPDVYPTLRPLELGTPVDAPVEVRVYGTEIEPLFAIVDQVKEFLAARPGVLSVTDDWGNFGKNLVVNVDQTRATQARITSSDIAISLQTVLSGLETTQFRVDDDAIPIELRTIETERSDIGKLHTMNVFSQETGRTIPLMQVADLEVAFEPTTLYRRNRLRAVNISLQLAGGTTAKEITDALSPWLEEHAADWPFGYSWELGGEYEQSIRAMGPLMDKMPIAIVIIILLLVAQFNSMRRPLIILMTVPLGLIGVTIGLLGAGSYFGFFTLLGILALSGIVMVNAIVLLDRINLEMDGFGREPREAVIEAAQRRLKPILMATTTTIGGLLPLWLGGGPMFEPLAIAMIFGLAFATLLTLGVVPTLYSIFFRLSFKDYTYATAGAPVEALIDESDEGAEADLDDEAAEEPE